MAIEIERKFLLKNDSWRTAADAGTRYRQGYLNRIEETGGTRSSVRVRTSGEHAYLNIKSATLGIRRQEFEYAIPLADAEELLAGLCVGAVIEKTRYHVRVDAHLWEIDVFEGDNSGLIVAEIELRAEDETFVRPEWVGQEVSNDPRYYNVCLAERPFCSW